MEMRRNKQKYHTVWTIPISNFKIKTPTIQIHNRPLPAFGTVILSKSDVVKLY
jgi:hypothetical protein